jgi:hypothetical protein
MNSNLWSSSPDYDCPIGFFPPTCRFGFPKSEERIWATARSPEERIPDSVLCLRTECGK